MFDIDLNMLKNGDFAQVEFFMLFWNPSAEINLNISGTGPFVINKGKHFSTITSKCPNSGNGLVRQINKSFVLFRGYELDLSLHSYSENEEFLNNFSIQNYKNGVFTLAVIDEEEKCLTIKTDAFGVSPLYYRKHKTTYIFASHPLLIGLENDTPNLFAWMSLLQNGFIYGENTIYKNISRVPQGSFIHISQDGMSNSKWYSFSKLPDGTELIGKNTFKENEERLRKVLKKSTKLNLPHRILPFSSGYDSRRLLVNLDWMKTSFTAVTCQSYHRIKGVFYDLDSVFAKKIAKKIGCNTQIVAATKTANLLSDFKTRLALIGSESFMHTWSIPLIRWFQKQKPSIIFDGLGGDVTGNGEHALAGFHKSPQRNLELVIDTEINPGVFKLLNTNWPRKDEFIDDYKSALNSFPFNMNQVELAYLQFRTRRSISPWINMMHPPGHVVVFPYYDLDMIENSFRYHPKEKNKILFQKECLRQYWPSVADMEGTRKIPEDIEPLPRHYIQERERSEMTFLFKGVGNQLNQHLNFKSKIHWELSKRNPFFMEKAKWFFSPLCMLELVGKQGHVLTIDTHNRTKISD